MLNLMRQQAAQIVDDRSTTRLGIVENYDPDNYSVRVSIQPEGNLTNWIPLASLWVGNGWGLFAPPSIGDMVELEFQEGDKDAPICNLRLYTDSNRPLSVPSGEFWLVHKSGSALKFHNDGTVEVMAAAEMTYTATMHHFVGPVQMDNTLNVTQTLSGEGGMTVTGDNGSGNTTTVNGNVNFVGQVSANGHRIDDTHKHSNGNGGANTGVPL